MTSNTQLEKRLKDVDIIYVEDDDSVSDLVKIHFDMNGWKYIHVRTLVDFSSALQTHKAKIYFFDGNFPTRNKSGPKPNAFKAYDLVIEQSIAHCYNPRFILHTTDARFQDLGDQSNIAYLTKVTKPDEIMRTVTERLGL